MFGLISKKKLLKEMDRIRESGKKKNNGVKYPPNNENDKSMNCVLQGYEDGHDNFYNALYARIFKK